MSLAASGDVCSTATGSRRRHVRGASPPPPPAEDTAGGLPPIGGVMSNLFGRKELLQPMRDELKKEKYSGDLLVAGACEGFDFLEAEVNLHGDPRPIKAARQPFVNSVMKNVGKAKDALVEDDKSEGNCGQPLTDTYRLLGIAGFGVETSVHKTDEATGDGLQLDNISIEFLTNNILCRTMVEEECTPKASLGGDDRGKFIAQHFRIADWSLKNCRGTKEAKRGNKWPVMRKQLEQKSKEIGLPKHLWLDFWSFLSLINLGFYAAYHYAVHREPLHVLHACIRNVELLHDNPHYEPLEGPLVRVYNSPHPEAVSRFLANLSVHTPQKLERYQEHLFLFLRRANGLPLPDGTEATAPATAERVKVYRRWAKIEGLSEAEITRQKTAIAQKMAQMRAAMKSEAHTLLGDLVVSKKKSLEEAIEIAEEASVNLQSIWWEIEAFRKHLKIATKEIENNARHVFPLKDGSGMKVVVLRSTEWYGADGDRVSGATSNTYFSKYGGEGFEGDWRRVLFEREGIDLSKFLAAGGQKALDIAKEGQVELISAELAAIERAKSAAPQEDELSHVK